MGHIAARRLILAVLATVAIPGPAGAVAAPPHAGSLDRTFGANGRVLLDLPGERMRPRAMAVQPDGRIVVAGHLTGSGTVYEPGSLRGRIFVARFLADGSLDTAFADAGVARIGFSALVAVDGLATQPDGAVLVAGTGSPPEGGYGTGTVARLLPTGALDEGFGSGGLATVPGESPGGYPISVHALPHLAVQADGRIVAAGYQDAYDVHDSADPLTVRLLPDGTPDPSFDGNGASRSGTRHPTAVLAQPDGDVVIVGWRELYFGGSWLEAFRLSPGTNDFPPAQAVPSNVFATWEYRRSLTGIAAEMRADGSVLFVGGLYQSHGLGSLAWVRIGPNLELLERRKAPIEGVEAATFDSRGALLTAGPWLAGFDGPPFKVQRYRGARLRLDRSFGDREGKRYFHLRRPAKLLGVAMQDDKLIVAGYRWSDLSGDQPLILIRLYARQDTAAPKIAVIGLPRRHCVRGSSSPLVRAHDESRVRTQARLDGHRLTTSNRHRFRIHLDTNQLASGRHVLTLRATDAAGNDSRARHTIRVCR